LPGPYIGVDVSRDGKKLAVHRHDTNAGDIWLLDSAQGPMSRLTFGVSQENINPVWSPDAARIAFGSLRDGKWGIYQKAVNGSASEELLLESDLPKAPMSWSPDGKYLVYSVLDVGLHLWALPLFGERKPFPIAQGKNSQDLGQISPDGRWIAYKSSETGREEIHIRDFPEGKTHWQLTTDGALSFSVRWRADGKELYYVASPAKIMAIPISVTGSTIQWGKPKELFDSGYVSLPHATQYHDYAVSPDGQRFLIPRAQKNLPKQETPPIVVVLDWSTTVKNAEAAR